MTYDYGSSMTYTTAKEPLAIPRPISQSPDALKRLAETSAAYSAAAAKFIDARADLNDARMNWQAARDEFAKLAEQEGI